MRDLARELTRRGHEAHVITATPGPPGQDGFPVHRLRVPLLPVLRTIANRRALDVLEEIVRRERFDLLHCHAGLSPLAIGGVHVARRLGIPSVVTEHSVLRGQRTLLRLLDSVSGWLGRPDVLSGVSRYVVQEQRRIYRRDDIVVLPNGIDLDAWRVQRPPTSELRVTSVMRFTRRKRPTDFVRAIPEIMRRLPPGICPRFTLVGDGPERPRVEREAHRLGVEDLLELPGLLSRQEIKHILARSALFVLPTIKEALSIATLEARCVGLPVVARNHGGVSDALVHGRHGFLADTWEEFIDYIVRLLCDAELRHRMAEEAKLDLDRFAWDEVIWRHERVYQMAQERCARSAGLAPLRRWTGPAVIQLGKPVPRMAAEG